MLFVGTGVSTAIPVIGHLGRDCACSDAMQRPTGPNRRNNVSLLIRLQNGHDVLIDVGKTFRDAYFATLAPRGVDRVSAVLLTHEHADAIQGVDDLRDLQTFRYEETAYTCIDPLPTYLSEFTLNSLNKGLDYVVRASVNVGSAHVEPPTDLIGRERTVPRRVSCLELHVVDDAQPRPLCIPAMGSTPIFSVPVLHGGDYRCLGFAFGSGCTGGEGDCFVYLSDVSSVPAEAMAFLKALPRIDVLVVDMLMREKHFSHFNVDDAWDLIMELQPRRAFGTGMYCDLEHDALSQELRERLAAHKAGLGAEQHCAVEAVEVAFDGLELPMHL